MAATVRVFDFNIDVSGASVVVVHTPLSESCLSDSEVDHNIQALKEDLDAVAARMKRAIREHKTKPIF